MTTTPRIRLFKVIVPAGTILLFVVLLILIESILRFVTPTYRLDLMRNSVAILHVYDDRAESRLILSIEFRHTLPFFCEVDRPEFVWIDP